MIQNLLLLVVSASFCFSCLVGFDAKAQVSAQVLKSKGRKAIIEVTSGERLEPGDEIEIRFADELVAKGEQATVGSRGNSISGEFTFGTTSTNTERANVPDSQSEVSTFALTGRYGWNSGKYEYGPSLTYEGQTVDSENISSGRWGGFFEYNFMKPNKSGVEFVPTAGLSLELLNATLDSSSGSGYGLSIYIGGKYFLLSDTLAFTSFLTFNQDSIRYSNERTDTSQSTLLTVGLAQYY